MSNDYAALIKNARDIPVLNTGIDNSVTSESTFPTKEHPSLLTHTGKTVNTPLNITLSARHIKVPMNSAYSVLSQTGYNCEMYCSAR